jgi:LuxR family maltose regulon positive regulatory protein
LRLDEAEAHLERGVALARRIGRPLLEINGLAHWGLLASFRSPALAVERGRRAIELAQRHGLTGEPLVAMAYPMLAGSLIWQGELEEAERWLMEGEYALRSEVEPATGMLFHVVRGGLKIARGRVEVARAALRGAGRLPGGQAHCSAPTHDGGARVPPPRPRAARGDCTGRCRLDRDGRRGTRKAGIRTAVAALQLAQHQPRAATTALAPVLDSSAPGSHQCG